MAGERRRVGAGVHVMTAHAHSTALGFLPAVLLWFAMMAAMMAPTAWPWIRAFQRFGGTGATATSRFAAGYALAWLGYAAGAASLQWTFLRLEFMPGSSDTLTPAAGALIFVVAGLYQFAPLKRACLTHCRTPIGYFLTNWRDGPRGALRMGFQHGVFCVGCCWALMLTAFAVGVMNLWWMVMLCVLTLAEQVAPRGHILRRGAGGALVVAGLVRLGLF